MMIEMMTEMLMMTMVVVVNVMMMMMMMMMIEMMMVMIETMMMKMMMMMMIEIMMMVIVIIKLVLCTIIRMSNCSCLWNLHVSYDATNVQYDINVVTATQYLCVCTRYAVLPYVMKTFSNIFLNNLHLISHL